MNFILLLSLIASTLLQAPDCDQTKLRQLAQRSDIILIARVIEVRHSPGYWSGLAPSIQQVRYEVDAVLKGNVTDKEIVVGHYVVKNSLTAEADSPELSRRLFAVGNQLVLFLKASQKAGDNTGSSGELEYTSPNENCGALIADNETINEILGLISSNNSRKKAQPISNSQHR
jgi:hypothetical protein